jgi:hypothetical protein
MGWTVDYWLAVTGPPTEPGIDGGIKKRDERIKSGRSAGPVITFSVGAVDESIKAVIRAGGR